MASEDFERLMNLIYFEEYKVSKLSLRVRGEEAIAEVTLTKGSDEIILQSSCEDFFNYVTSLKKTANTNGKFQFTKIENTAAYYEDMDFLRDINGKKLQAAIKKVQSGNFVLDFDIEKIFDDFLSGKYGKNDKDIIKLKTYYFDIFAFTLFLSKEYLKIKEKIERANKEFIEYYLLTDEILRMAFIKVGKPVEAIEDYKFFKNFLSFDIVNNARSATEQGYWYANDLLGMLAEREVVEGAIGIKYLLDMYRRFCESSFEFINMLRIAIEVADGVEKPESYLSYLENVKRIKSKQKYSKFVESIDPHIRHSESHMNTRIDDEKGEIVLIDTSRGKEEVVGKYTFHELSDMTKTIQRSLYPALITSFMIFETAFKLLIFISPEYKYMLLKLKRS
ncbi:MAG: hypothetical protein U9N61_09605 [Euryarchaeota archaeon]|nr:hypothetical protein [Euryarchaeota archaeon]